MHAPDWYAGHQIGNPFINILICFAFIAIGLWLLYQHDPRIVCFLMGRPYPSKGADQEDMATRIELEHQSDSSRPRQPPRTLPEWRINAMFDQGLRFELHKDDEKAAYYFFWTLDARPMWAEPRYRLALAYARLHKKEKAWEQYELLKDVDSEYAGRLYRQLTEFQLI